MSFAARSVTALISLGTLVACTTTLDVTSSASGVEEAFGELPALEVDENERIVDTNEAERLAAVDCNDETCFANPGLAVARASSIRLLGRADGEGEQTRQVSRELVALGCPSTLRVSTVLNQRDMASLSATSEERTHELTVTLQTPQVPGVPAYASLAGSAKMNVLHTVTYSVTVTFAEEHGGLIADDPDGVRLAPKSNDDLHHILMKASISGVDSRQLGKGVRATLTAGASGGFFDVKTTNAVGVDAQKLNVGTATVTWPSPLVTRTTRPADGREVPLNCHEVGGWISLAAFRSIGFPGAEILKARDGGGFEPVLGKDIAQAVINNLNGYPVTSTRTVLAANGQRDAVTEKTNLRELVINGAASAFASAAQLTFENPPIAVALKNTEIVVADTRKAPVGKSASGADVYPSGLALWHCLIETRPFDTTLTSNPLNPPGRGDGAVQWIVNPEFRYVGSNGHDAYPALYAPCSELTGAVMGSSTQRAGYSGPQFVERVTDVSMVAIYQDDAEALVRTRQAFQLEHRIYGKNYYASWAKDGDARATSTALQIMYTDSADNVGASGFKRKNNAYADPSVWKGNGTINVPSLAAFSRAVTTPWAPEGSATQD